MNQIHLLVNHSNTDLICLFFQIHHWKNKNFTKILFFIDSSVLKICCHLFLKWIALIAFIKFSLNVLTISNVKFNFFCVFQLLLSSNTLLNTFTLTIRCNNQIHIKYHVNKINKSNINVQIQLSNINWTICFHQITNLSSNVINNHKGTNLKTNQKNCESKITINHKNLSNNVKNSMVSKTIKVI